MAGRFYEPVAICDNEGYDHFGFRGQSSGHHHRVLGRELRLTWDRADRLCDILEEVRRIALESVSA